MKSLKFLLIGSVAALLLSGCSAIPKKAALTTPEEPPKFYLSAVPIEHSQAFANFLCSPKTEREKLNYLIDRIREARSTTFYFEGSHYGWTEACAAGNWLLWRRYKDGEDARTFLRREASYTPNRAAFLMLADGQCPVYQALLNELELLEEKLKPTLSIPQTA